jgi:hypothetical protein
MRERYFDKSEIQRPTAAFSMNLGEGEALFPMYPERHLTPALSPTSWRRGGGHRAEIPNEPREQFMRECFETNY